MKRRGRRGPTICLAASGGGHLRQILDLAQAWSGHTYFIVTEDTALGRSVAEEHPTQFVPHFAIGQARLGKALLMVRRALASAWLSFLIVRRRRPDIVLTTGAGSLLFVVLWARLCGADVVILDSIARFHGPSAFARLAGPLAHLRIAPTAEVARNWLGAIVFDPFRQEAATPMVKQALLVATVGATLPFPRLIELVLRAKREGLIEEDVLLQVGEGAEGLPTVPGVRIVDSLPFEQLRAALRDARIVVCHGGTGSILTALDAQCATIAVPRRFERQEHYDNHQAEICEAFAARGLIQLADDDAGFAAALATARTQQAKSIGTDYDALTKLLRERIDAL